MKGLKRGQLSRYGDVGDDASRPEIAGTDRAISQNGTSGESPATRDWIGAPETASGCGIRGIGRCEQSHLRFEGQAQSASQTNSLCWSLMVARNFQESGNAKPSAGNDSPQKPSISHRLLF